MFSNARKPLNSFLRIKNNKAIESKIILKKYQYYLEKKSNLYKYLQILVNYFTNRFLNLSNHINVIYGSKESNFQLFNTLKWFRNSYSKFVFKKKNS